MSTLGGKMRNACPVKEKLVVQTEHAKVLVTVTASPEPSTQYGDTTCVAGIRVDSTPAEWIRLYPVPMRWFSESQRFHKYQVIEADLVPPTNDKRAESHRVVLDSLKPVGEVIKGWESRGKIVEQFVGPTMCDLNEGIKKDKNGPSLGLVRVRQLKSMKVGLARDWTDAEWAKIQNAQQQVALFGENPPPPLERPRLSGQITWFCEAPTCKSHTQTILDWEFTTFQRRLRGVADDVAKEKIRAKFQDEICGPKNRVYFYVGNMHDMTKRASFSILGFYYPPAASDFGAVLDFDSL
jgi:hypothetical protein